MEHMSARRDGTHAWVLWGGGAERMRRVGGTASCGPIWRMWAAQAARSRARAVERLAEQYEAREQAARTHVEQVESDDRSGARFGRAGDEADHHPDASELAGGPR